MTIERGDQNDTIPPEVHAAFDAMMTPEKVAELDAIVAEIDDPRRYVIVTPGIGVYYNAESDLYSDDRDYATEFKVRSHAEAVAKLLNDRTAEKYDHPGECEVVEVEKVK